MPLKLMYITNSEDVAHIAEEAGVDRIFVDMEYIGKTDRQQNQVEKQWEKRRNLSELFGKQVCMSLILQEHRYVFYYHFQHGQFSLQEFFGSSPRL